MSRAFVFVNGELPNDQVVFERIQNDDVLIAVDGGLQHLKRMGLKPNLLVGDLDSVDSGSVKYLIDEGIEVLQYPPEKDKTDLELALQICLDRRYSPVFIVAALGGRIDQTLANIALLTSPDMKGLELKLFDGVNELMLIEKKAVLEGSAGDTVSLIPLDEQVNGVRTQGLLYPLNKEPLYRWRTRGISNQFVQERVEIEVSGGGVLLCVHTRKQK